MTAPAHDPTASPGSTVRPLLIVFVSLLVLLALTMGAARLDLGPWATPVALLIAAAKTALIAVWFMQLRLAPALTRLAACTGLVFLGIALSLTWLDYFTRG